MTAPRLENYAILFKRLMPFIGSSATNRSCWRRLRSAWRGWSGRMTGCLTSTLCRIPTTTSNTCCTPTPDNAFDRQLCLGPRAGHADSRPSRVGRHRHAARRGRESALSSRCCRSSGGRRHCRTALPGEVEKVSSRDGDIHRVSNALAESVSISIHVYGGNIGAVKRAVYTRKVSSNPLFPATQSPLTQYLGFPEG